MDKLDPERLPDVVEGLTREDVMMECHQEGRINRQEKDKLQEHMADVTVGMLYLACMCWTCGSTRWDRGYFGKAACRVCERKTNQHDKSEKSGV